MSLLGGFGSPCDRSELAGCHGPPPSRRRPAGGRLIVTSTAGVAVLATALSAGTWGCAPTPPTVPASRVGSTSEPAPGGGLGRPPAPAGTHLLLLAGSVGAMRLGLVGEGSADRPLALPDAHVTWISTARSGRILATTADGRAYLAAPPTAAADLAWRSVVGVGRSGSPRQTPIAFGTLAPNGERAAFLATDAASGKPGDIVIVSVSTGPRSTIPTGFRLDGSPPCWTPEGLVVLARGPTDEVGSIVVDPITGSIRRGPGPPFAPATRSTSPRPVRATSAPTGMAWTGAIAALSVSASGDVVAIAGDRNGTIEVGATSEWLAGRWSAVNRVRLDPMPDGAVTFSWLALDSTGDRLAVVRTNLVGDTIGVSVLARQDGWQGVRRIDLPAGWTRAVVAWIP